MKVAIYPGSFNPWHRGHQDILNKALMVFDKVIVAIGRNTDKTSFSKISDVRDSIAEGLAKDGELPKWPENVEVTEFKGLLVDYVRDLKVDAVIKGLRNPTDFEYEKTQQYWNEDLGISIPTFFVVSDREYTHLSSSAVRMLANFQK